MATSAEPTDVDLNDDAFAGLHSALGELAEGIEAAESEEESDKDPFEEAAEKNGDKASESPAESGEESPETPEPEADPLENAPSLTYTVRGESKAADYVKIYAESDGTVRGGVIPAEQLEKVAQRFAAADYFEQVGKELYEEAQRYRALEFTDGTKQTHRGIEAFDAALSENAKLNAAVRVFADVIENPEKLLALAYAVQQGDQSEMARLQKELGYALKDAEWNLRDARGRRSTEATTQQQEQQQIEATTKHNITQSVEHWGARYPELTADDKTKAIAFLTRLGSAIVRRASHEEARTAGVQPGSLIIDHTAVDRYLAERAELRRAAAVSAKAQTTAATENAKRLAAAARGTTPKSPKKPAASPTGDDGLTWQQIKDKWSSGQYVGVDAGE